MNRILTALMGFSLIVLFFVSPSMAQYGEPRIAADIPFDFVVGNVSLPAGQYQFQRNGANFLQVRDANGYAVFTLVPVSMQEDGASEKSTLKFANVDGRHFLIEIWDGQAAWGSEFFYKHASPEVGIPATVAMDVK